MLITAAEAETLSQQFRSGPAPVSLLELFTSEGCSSCPPAEKWLGDLREETGLWRDFVPVAFHVNYWDHLGWRDALASAAFTQREHAYAAAWNAESVYTPCFVRNCIEWRPTGGRLTPVTGASPAGQLTITWNPGNATCNAEYTPDAKAMTSRRSRNGDPEFAVSVALLGSGIVTRVRNGENAGRELHHEFVALRLETKPLKQNEQGTWSATVPLPSRNDIAASRHALAAWITPRGKLAPLQATGGWLDK
jgi:hypothetical protein